MAKKTPDSGCFVLKLKLQALQDYLSHWEHKLDEFRVELRKAFLFRNQEDPCGLADRVTTIVANTYVADPPPSLFEADLAQARAGLNARISAEPGWAKRRKGVLASVSAILPADAGFDLLLSSKIGTLHADFVRLFGGETPLAIGSDEWARELFALMEGFVTALNEGLKPARLLREEWIARLEGRPATRHDGSEGRARRGRPKDAKAKERNKRMHLDKMANQTQTWAEVGQKEDVTANVARKAVTEIRKQAAKQAAKMHGK